MPALDDDSDIEAIGSNRIAHCEPMGWHHWPEYPWLSFQIRRGLGATQGGGGAVSETFLAASRMIPGDRESRHTEWTRLGDDNWERAIAQGVPETLRLTDETESGADRRALRKTSSHPLI